ncbi:MAG: FliA/WhiG family RNA polymerase sigma factor [Anaerolineae bacterium]|nr:FliA/WhiG family RNA polymerase sigma factor [Anaerolineae bacterium]
MDNTAAMGNAGIAIDDLWQYYRANGDTAARDQIILYYAPLVKRVANRLSISESAPLDFQDRISHGMLGLIEAVDRFDPQRGVIFETFATQRIRGAILDALREMDHASRSVRRRASEIERALADLRARLGRVPEDEEVADYLGMTLDTYRKILSQANIVFLSLDSPLGDLHDGGDGMVLGEILEDPTSSDIATEMEEHDLRLALEAAIGELPERDRLILSLYYYEELTVREVGEVLDISTTRVSQLLGRAIMTLRARLIYDRERTPVRPGAAAAKMMPVSALRV